MSEVILRSETYKIKSFREILVADPWYLEKEYDKHRDDLVFNEKPRCCKIGCVQIQEVQDEIHPEFGNFVNVSIILSATEKQQEVYLQDKFYTNTIKHQVELGCDTAQFVMELHDKKGECRSCEIDTGADGFYGRAVQYKEGYGMRIDLWLDADVTSFEEIRQEMEYLFQIDIKKDLLHCQEPNHLKQEDIER